MNDLYWHFFLFSRLILKITLEIYIQIQILLFYLHSNPDNNLLLWSTSSHIMLLSSHKLNLHKYNINIIMFDIYRTLLIVYQKIINDKYIQIFSALTKSIFEQKGALLEARHIHCTHSDCLYCPSSSRNDKQTIASQQQSF